MEHQGPQWKIQAKDPPKLHQNGRPRHPSPSRNKMRRTDHVKQSSENVGATATHTTQTRKVAGGLAILWNPNSVILNQGLSTPGTLTTHYRAIGSDKNGWITNAYGPQTIQEKEIFLQHLAYLSSLANNQRWIVGMTST
jgi:hypothetical protein